jgi:glycerophosphoryl diester phosphodiesterase
MADASSMVRPLVIGHRGFAARFPENTAAAARAALAVGADGIEVDVRLSSDCVWVCHHNLSSDGTPVGTLPWRRLRARGVSTLEEVLVVVPQARWLFLEIKPLTNQCLARGASELIRLLAERWASTRILSSSTTVLQQVPSMLPGTPRSWVIRAVPQMQPPREWSLSPRHQLVEELLPLGRPLHPWAVNRPYRLRALAALGVASITSDNPERALQVLAS